MAKKTGKYQDFRKRLHPRLPKDVWLPACWRHRSLHPWLGAASKVYNDFFHHTIKKVKQFWHINKYFATKLGGFTYFLSQAISDRMRTGEVDRTGQSWVVVAKP
jgi:hypothetical protein